MKIIVDKLDAPPPHALNREEVRNLFDIVPREWRTRYNAVHLKATFRDNTHYYQIVSAHGSQLNICSRGMPVREVYRHLLRALAVRELNHYSYLVRHLSRLEMAELDSLIAPYLQRLERKEIPIKQPSDPAPLSHYAMSRKLQSIGYTWEEAYAILRAIEDEKRHPTSRTKANRITRAIQVCFEAGFDPFTMSFVEESLTGADNP